MANFEHKNGTGSLFKNDKKQTADTQPDYTGVLKDLNGKSWRIAGWIKNGTKGSFLSVSMSEPKTQNDKETLPF